MDNKNHTINLYASQTDAVLKVIEKDGICFSREEYVRLKYEESAPIFVTAYSWFVAHAQKFVPKPDGAAYPYWAFMDLCSVDLSAGGNLLRLNVPLDDAVFFDMADWTKILKLSYIGENEADEKVFLTKMHQCGVTANDAMLTSFYPEWKQRITSSWERLFRHHEQIKAGDYTGVQSVQAGLWCIRRDWIQP